ncbi:S-adenosyl-L-methionine-dependent methyltransferase [Suillus plorans]|uniref:tRNA (guanine(26)-N(2))-dimethyltransferase n=1 Tax=Suillus plorans TaxID=116603 RepID=A0A9P7J5M3_9AGAM|nr:S-adenosyl-L-methionine-dependent methyltransferase [Suillus plorans]KAG1803816.1 S-adenosyl-L-methionine-dependent methyltransferase [Suillus plorans]
MSDSVGSSSITVPEGFTLHTENTSHILISSKEEAFLNPVQEFNRDLSVACIRVWSEELNREKEAKWKQAQERRAKREAEGEVKTYRPHKFVLLEALSATGLRSIRYAKEIPLVRFVIANDLSASATAAMKRNVELNGLGPSSTGPADSASSFTVSEHQPLPDRGKVRINEGDACALMYNHRTEKTRVDVVDLDPYGTAAPFIDGAVQCVNDGGNFSNYGGIPVKAEYCHEAALRLVLNTLSTSAGRYGRYIEPLLCLSIDFYVRLFVRIHSAPIEVKKTASKTAMYFVCQGCQAFYEQPLGRIVEKVHERSGNVNLLFKTQAGPPVPQKCTECGSALHVAGPMWSGSLHNNGFISKVLEHLGSNQDRYSTAVRMKGMLTVANEELHVPFYFTPSRIAGFFHSVCPPLDDVASALLNAGHTVSRSHALPGSLKTDATRQDVHDVFRSWVKKHPVRMDKVSETSLARQLLAKEARTEANFTRHPRSVTQASKVKLVRYQQNPAPNWGPGTKADTGTKRKREEENP